MSKIIIDIRLLSKGRASGIEEYTKSLVGEFLRADGGNSFRLFYNGARKAPLPQGWAKAQNARVIDSRIPNKVLDILIRFLGFPRVETLTGGGDAVFSPHFNILATRLPRVITFHDLSFVSHPDFFAWRHRLWHWFQNSRGQARRAERIIAISEYTKSDLVNLYGVKPERVSVIYSGVNSMFRKIPAGDSGLSACREKFALRRPYILYLGTVEPRKNIASLIKAFTLLKRQAEYRDFELIIAGPRGWLFGGVFAEAARSRARDDIHFLGPVASDDRVYLYNLASLFVYPSFFEGFGFQPLEAQACGVPVIASNRTSLPEILGNSARLIDPWNVEELCEAMKSVFTGSSLRDFLIGAGYDNVKRFTWERAARETLELFR